MALLGTVTIDLHVIGDTVINLTNPGSGNYMPTGYGISGATAQPDASVGLAFYTGPNATGVVWTAPGGNPLHADLSTPSQAWGGPVSNPIPLQPAAGEKLYAHVSTANSVACSVDVAIFGEPTS